MFFKHIESYVPIDDKDLENLEKIKAFIETDKDNLFSRTNLKGHITASAWVVNPKMDKVLLVHHKKLSKWLQPGGHADGCADILKMARQEVWEETGAQETTLAQEGIFDVDVHPIPENMKHGKVEPAHIHYDIRYLLVADDKKPVEVSDESHDVRWFDMTQAAGLNAELARMVEKTINKQGA